MSRSVLNYRFGFSHKMTKYIVSYLNRLTLTRTLNVFTPSSMARSMSSIRLSVEPLITKVEMAPSSFSVIPDKYSWPRVN